MPISPKVKEMVTLTFQKCLQSTSSGEKKGALKAMQQKLLTLSSSDSELYDEFMSAVTDNQSAFSKAIDIKTGLGKLSSSASNTRTEMGLLARKLSLFIERTQGNVALHALNDERGRGFGKVQPAQGSKNKISKAYDITQRTNLEFDGSSFEFHKVAAGPSKEQIETALKQQEKARFISRGDVFNVFNKAGLDFKGQSNYANLTLLKGGGIDLKANLIGLFFPPAAAVGLNGSIKTSANLLGGKQLFVYCEVVNGNNGDWHLPLEEDVKRVLLSNIVSELKILDGTFFEEAILMQGLGATLTAQDADNPSQILEALALIQFQNAPTDLLGLHDIKPDPPYTTEDFPGGAASGNLCIAIQRAVDKTNIQISHSAAGGHDYNAIVVAGCMRGFAWEWMGKLGLEIGWSPLNISAIKNVTQYLTSSTSWSSDDAAQYVAIGVSCSLAAEASAGRTNRSFIATDRNARIFVKGTGGAYPSTHGNLSSYLSDCIRYSTDESLIEYIDDLFRAHYKSVSDYKKLSLEELKAKADTKVAQLINLKQASSNDAEINRLDGILRQIRHAHELLNDRINQKSNDPISRFVLAYSGTTWDFAAKTDIKLGLKITEGEKKGLWSGMPSSGTSAYGSSGLNLIGSLINHARAYRTSRYTIQVPLIKSNLTHQLHESFRGAIAQATGVLQLKELWSPLGPEEIAPSCLRFKTQETTVSYRKIETKMLADLKLENNLIPLPGMKPGQSKTLLERPKEKQPKAEYGFLNTIEYQTAIAVWEPTDHSETLKLCPGSGRCYGQAFVLTKLLQLAKDSRATNLDADTTQKLEILAKALRVKTQQLKAFFGSKEFKQAMPDNCNGSINPWANENFEAQEGCVLIESTFSKSNLESTLRRKAVSIRDPEDRFNIATESVLDSPALPDVDPDRNEYSLQTIRIRYRMADLKEDKSTPFKLGLYFPGTIEVGIRVEAVENMGMSGIVDILTYWFDGQSSGSVMYNRDNAVVGTILVTQ